MATTKFLQIADILDTVCPILGNLSAECHFMVCNYIDDIIDLIVDQYVQPEEVCLDIQLCP